MNFSSIWQFITSVFTVAKPGLKSAAIAAAPELAVAAKDIVSGDKASLVADLKNAATAAKPGAEEAGKAAVASIKGEAE